VVGNAHVVMAKPIVSVSRRPQSVLVAVCAKCDGDGKALRREMKRDLKARGRPERNRADIAAFAEQVFAPDAG